MNSWTEKDNQATNKTHNKLEKGQGHKLKQKQFSVCYNSILN